MSAKEIKKKIKLLEKKIRLRGNVKKNKTNGDIT